MRDFPEVVSKIIWINQLGQKLQFYQTRVKEVLGDDWEAQQEGADLKKTCENLTMRLQRTQKEYFENWNLFVTNLNVQAERDKSIFRIEQRGNKFNLVLNFNENLFSLSKEKINLEKVIQHFELPYKMAMAARFKSETLEPIYPIAMSLQQSLRTF